MLPRPRTRYVKLALHNAPDAITMRWPIDTGGLQLRAISVAVAALLCAIFLVPGDRKLGVPSPANPDSHAFTVQGLYAET